MKQRLLLWMVLFLSVMGTWAKDVNSTKASPDDDALTLTLIVKDHAGQPIPAHHGVSIACGNEEGIYYQTDENGTIIAPVRVGEVRYNILSINSSDPGISAYLGISGTVTVTDASIAKVISYQDARLLTFELTGNSLPSTDYEPSVDVFPPGDGISGYIKLQRVSESPLAYKGQIYVMDDGTYGYVYGTRPYWSGRRSQKIIVSGDQTIRLALDNCQKVTFTLNGESFDPSSRIFIRTANGESVGTGYSFLPPGKYTASPETRFDNSTIYLKEQAFTVADAPVTVDFAFNPSDYHKVDVSFQNFSDGKYGHITFMSDSYLVECSSNSPDPYVYLPSGDYTYSFSLSNKTSNMEYPLVGTIRITDKEESLTIDANSFMHVAITVKNPEGRLVKDALFQLEKNGVSEWEDGNESVDALELFAPEGTYNLSISRAGYRTLSTNATINASTQTLEYTLQSANVTSVIFDVYDAYLDDQIPGAKVTLAGYGSQTGIGGEDDPVIFTNVVPADNLAYTVEAPGYETLAGMLSVSLSDGEPYIYVEVDMTGKAVGIGNTATDGREIVCVYPTTPEDYLYIRPESGSIGEWKLQLVSTTGAMVYSNKMQLDGETPVYVGNLPEGFYLLTLNNGEQRLTFKVIKK